MKILLVQPFKDPGLVGESYPPIGLGYLATAVRKSGHSVSILDCLQNYTYKTFMREVMTFSPDIIGITLYSISIPFVRTMIDMIKKQKPDTIVVLGGPHVSSLPEKVLIQLNKADFAIRGEGEIPFRQFADYLESRNIKLSKIPGLIFRESGEIRINNPYFAGNIEDYGYPAWDLINPPDYFKHSGVGSYSVPVFFSRGCPFQCTFCAAKVTSGQRLRRRDLEHIFKELHFLQRDYKIQRFIIEDEGFGVSKQFIMDFCQRRKAEDLKAVFSMGVGMRLDIVDRELLGTMRESNFDKIIALGIESGSERILGLMKKNTNLKIIWERTTLMDEMGFEPTGYFIIGYPGETKEEMKQTIRLAMKLPIREASFTSFQPLPGTEATKMLIETGELPADFDFSEVGPNKIAYAPSGISLKEMEHIRKMAILKFYLRPQVILRYFRSLQTFTYALKKVFAVFLKKNIIQ